MLKGYGSNTELFSDYAEILNNMLAANSPFSPSVANLRWLSTKPLWMMHWPMNVSPGYLPNCQEMNYQLLFSLQNVQYPADTYGWLTADGMAQFNVEIALNNININTPTPMELNTWWYHQRQLVFTLSSTAAGSSLTGPSDGLMACSVEVLL